MASKWSPGCRCCGVSCPQPIDDFERADSGTIGNGWSETGVWDIVSGTVQTASANAALSKTGAITTATGSFAASIRVRSSGDGDIIRLRLNASAQTEVRLKIGSAATVQLGDGSTSYSEAYSVTAAVNTWHDVVLVACAGFMVNEATTVAGCGHVRVYLNGVFVASHSLEASIINYANNENALSIVLGTTTCTGTVQFDDVFGYGYEPKDEVQSLRVNATGGTFTVTVNIDGAPLGTTTGIAFNASAATIKTALEVVVGSGNVTTTGGAVNVADVRVRFEGIYADTNVDAMTGSGTGLSGGASTLTITQRSFGGNCPPCKGCFYDPMDIVAGASQLKVVFAGFTGDEAAFNGTYFLDPETGSACAGFMAASHPCCRCYTVPVSLTYDGLSVTALSAYIEDLGAPSKRVVSVRFTISGSSWRMTYARTGQPANTMEYGPDKQIEDWQYFPNIFGGHTGSSPTTATLEPV